MSKILYLKIDQCIQVPNVTVTIGDVAKMSCTDPSVIHRLKTEKLLKANQDPNERMVISVLYVIEKIHQIYPELQIENVGESDFIISLRTQKTSKLLDFLKVFLVSTVSFLGSVFAMMTFNEDVSSLDSFRKVYTWVMGNPPEGATVLEFGYSLGLAVGILVFFNHFGKKKLTKEPSPVEVEMCGYDQQVYATFIQHEGRKGLEKDVD